MKTDVTNYLPLSLLSKASLSFEINIFDSFHNKLKGRSPPQQFGFQSRKSAVIQLIDFLQTVRLKNSTNFYTVYLDYAKVFDRVSFQVLVRKLRIFGLDENFICLCEWYFFVRYQSVIDQNEMSNPQPVLIGVSQGSVLCPLLFIIFLNNMPSIFLDAIAWLFADDLYFPFNSLNFEADVRSSVFTIKEQTFLENLSFSMLTRCRDCHASDNVYVL